MAKLIYLMGASGSGKDTLLNYLKAYDPNLPEYLSKRAKSRAKNLLNDENEQPHQRVLVAHRYITRAFDNSNENHVQLSESDFQFRLENGFFAMAWKANNLKYAVGREISDWVKQGHNVIVNGSRAYLPDAKKIFGKSLVAVCLNVPEEILVERLLARGRETQKQIEERIDRARIYTNCLPDYTHFIDNDCEIEILANRLYALLRMIDPIITPQKLVEEIRD